MPSFARGPKTLGSLLKQSCCHKKMTFEWNCFLGTWKRVTIIRWVLAFKHSFLLGYLFLQITKKSLSFDPERFDVQKYKVGLFLITSLSPYSLSLCMTRVINLFVFYLASIQPKTTILWNSFCLMSGHYWRVHGLECLMGNKCKMERNSTVCVEVQNDKKYSWYVIFVYFSIF